MVSDWVKRRALLSKLIVGLALLLLGAYAIWGYGRQSPADLNHPSAVLAGIQSFKPYYYEASPPLGFVLDSESMSFSANDAVLVFSLAGPTNKQVAFTEQALPTGVDTSQFSGDKQYANPYGQVFITDTATRTTGTLITSDGVWILANAPDSIGLDAMTELINELQPIESK